MTDAGQLRRVLGPATAFLVGLGVAIGSGIFRTPAIVAAELGSPVWMIAAWVAGGVFVLLSGLVSAELATRFPKAGGEYVYLREAYGRFVAFFFGWGYSVFIIGGGAATIAAAVGEASAELAGWDQARAPWLGCAAIVAVASINALGVKTGAGLQNALTAVKIVALLLVAGVAFAAEGTTTEWMRPLVAAPGRTALFAVLAALPPVLWAYEGTTDVVKLAEEVKDPHRALPRALIGSALTLTVLYVSVNLAYIWVLGPADLAASRFAANDVMGRLFGAGGHRAMNALSLVVLLGALSSTLLATVRVTFALARDGLGFSFMGRMSASQSPVGALVMVAGIALFFTAARGFAQILDIYFLAAAILFGLAYGSLLVFRARDRKRGEGVPPGVFRCPGGPWIASFLILVQLAMATRIVIDNPADSARTLALLAAVAAVYAGWRKVRVAKAG